MDADLATALATERAIVRRAVRRARGIDGGWVVRHPPLPEVWHLNRVHLTRRPEGPEAAWLEATWLEAAWLEALAARELAGVPHRRVTVDDEAAADAAWPSLESRGWRRERSVAMALVTPGRAPGPVDPPARELEAAALARFQPQAFADDAAVTAISDDLPARLAAAQAVLRGGTDWRAFGAGTAAGGLPAATATLYLDPDVDGRRVAFVDQVATLRPHRERGLARAVMAAALEAASEWNASLVALFADAEDWPQLFYASLGFSTVGRQTVFHRDAAEGLHRQPVDRSAAVRPAR